DEDELERAQTALCRIEERLLKDSVPLDNDLDTVMAMHNLNQVALQELTDIDRFASIVAFQQPSENCQQVQIVAERVSLPSSHSNKWSQLLDLVQTRQIQLDVAQISLDFLSGHPSAKKIAAIDCDAFMKDVLQATAPANLHTLLQQSTASLQNELLLPTNSRLALTHELHEAAANFEQSKHAFNDNLVSRQKL
ncbi:hypothetical protein Ciccas_014361, partial [Cichlidogyrus casuarinus]